MTKSRRGKGQGSLYKRSPAGPWIASWIDHAGKRRSRSTRTTDKASAQRILAKFVADSALRREGVIDPQDEAVAKQSHRAIEAHLADYEAMLRAGRRSGKHVTTTIGYVRAVAAWANFASAHEINADGVNRFANNLRAEGRSARTIQAYLRALKGFTKWLTQHGKLPRDPLVTVRTPNPETDRRLRRRFLLPEEWTWLRTAILESNMKREGTTAEERLTLYAVAIQTALRISELRSLMPSQINLDADPPFVRCAAATAKNRQAARQYIKPDAADALGRLLRERAPGTPVFALPDPSDVAEVLRADLADARTRWLREVADQPAALKMRRASDFLLPRNHADEWLDFHSLRHTCGAWLAMAGAHPKAIQTIMRHSTITLTMDTYGHLFPGQEAETIARLPDMLSTDAANGFVQRSR